MNPLLALVIAAPLALSPESRLWLEGTSSLHDWSCKAEALQVVLDAEAPELTDPGAAAQGVRGLTLTVPVARLACGESVMDEKLRDALKVAANPDIRFTLARLTPLPKTSAGAARVLATGDLTIAGRTRTISTVVTLTRDGEGWRASVAVAISMAAYGVAPPTAFLGLLKTGDVVTVRVDARVVLAATHASR